MDVYICYKYVLFYAHIFIIVNYEKMNEKETKRKFIDICYTIYVYYFERIYYIAMKIISSYFYKMLHKNVKW
jgi:hypothetical protein